MARAAAERAPAWAAERRERAREHLATAATMFGEMGMRFWLAQAEREAASLTVRDSSG